MIVNNLSVSESADAVGFFNGFRFDLPDALARDVEFLPHLLKRGPRRLSIRIASQEFLFARVEIFMISCT